MARQLDPPNKRLKASDLRSWVSSWTCRHHLTSPSAAQSFKPKPHFLNHNPADGLEGILHLAGSWSERRTLGFPTRADSPVNARRAEKRTSNFAPSDSRRRHHYGAERAGTGNLVGAVRRVGRDAGLDEATTTSRRLGRRGPGRRLCFRARALALGGGGCLWLDDDRPSAAAWPFHFPGSSSGRCRHRRRRLCSLR